MRFLEHLIFYSVVQPLIGTLLSARSMLLTSSQPVVIKYPLNITIPSTFSPSRWNFSVKSSNTNVARFLIQFWTKYASISCYESLRSSKICLL